MNGSDLDLLIDVHVDNVENIELGKIAPETVIVASSFNIKFRVILQIVDTIPEFQHIT